MGAGFTFSPYANKTSTLGEKRVGLPFFSPSTENPYRYASGAHGFSIGAHQRGLALSPSP
jgi:hypothetical protein